MSARLAIALAFLLCLGCGGEQSAGSGPKIVARASLLIEPPTLGIGDVTTAVLLVTTPAAHRVLPIAVPEVPGVWVLESLVDPTEKDGARWVHRTRIRMRPRETGAFEFPQTEVTIESESGEQSVLHVASREFEVVSILPSFPERTAPFGLEEAPAGDGFGFLLPSLVGAAVALLGVAAITVLRRRHVGPEAPTEAESPADSAPATLWDWAQRELGRAFEALDREPHEAANVGAHFMRQYVESRFHTHTAASTTEELATTRPPLAAHRHWPEFVEVLQRMDDARWRPQVQSRDEQVHRVRTALEAARGFLESSSGGRRGS